MRWAAAHSNGCATVEGVAALWIFHGVLQSSDCLLWGKSCCSDNLSLSFSTSFLARQQQQPDVQHARTVRNMPPNNVPFFASFSIGAFKYNPRHPRELPFLYLKNVFVLQQLLYYTKTYKLLPSCGLLAEMRQFLSQTCSSQCQILC